MIFTWLILQLKSLVLSLVNTFQRAFCCFRKRKLSYRETEQLTQVISNEDFPNSDNWSEWGHNAFKEEPKTVKDYIERYRDNTIKLHSEKLDEPQEQENFFEDMAPQIIRQTKVLIKNKNDEFSGLKGNRLSVTDDRVNVACSSELGEWDENSGWEGENLLDQEAQRVLREQKKLERERKAWEQHQKRLEKASHTLGSKLTA